MEKKTENLKEYFISRLLILMLFILVSESLIHLFISQEIFPVLQDMFGLELASEHLSVPERVGVLLQLLFYILGESLYSVVTVIIPAPVILVLQRILEGLERGNLMQMPEKIDGVLFLIVIAALILYILPYVVGVVLYSMTVVRKVEEIREYDREKNEEFIQRRNLLFSDIAHDLKTPITTISGYAQALNDGMVESPEKKKEYLQIIQKKSLQISRLITVLFDYVKLDSEGFELKKEPINLAEFLREISAEMYADIENAEMELEVKMPEEICSVLADRVQFARVIVNLLTNAVRHNPKGTQIKIALEEIYGYENKWRISIADTGPEVEASIAEHLFDPFVMGDASRNSKVGSGLGLSIAAKIAEMHGGKLSFRQPAEAPYRKAFCVELLKEKEGKKDDYEYNKGRIKKYKK